MSSSEQVLNEMRSVLTELVQVAKKLRDASRGTIDEKRVQQLQDEQELLIADLVAIDERYREVSQEKSGESDDVRVLREDIKEQIDSFQELNQIFIRNLQVRRGLIQLNLEETRKASSSLDSMKKAYGPVSKPSSKGKKNKINTIS